MTFNAELKQLQRLVNFLLSAITHRRRDTLGLGGSDADFVGRRGIFMRHSVVFVKVIRFGFVRMRK